MNIGSRWEYVVYFIYHDLNTMSDTCLDILYEPLFAQDQLTILLVGAEKP